MRKRLMRLLPFIAVFSCFLTVFVLFSSNLSAYATSHRWQGIPVPYASDGVGPTDPQELSQFLDANLETSIGKGISNAAFVLVKDGRVFFEHGYGYDRNQAIDPDTSVYFAASVSKLFVATAVMQLAEQGKLNLQTDVNTYLKHFQLEENYPKPVTLSNLLTHTAGFDDPFLDTIVPPGSKLPSLNTYFTAHVPKRVMAPGEQISYSNVGMALAASIVEQVSGIPFDHYVERYIFAPLGMQHSSFQQPLPAELASYLVGAHPGRGPDMIVPYPAASLVTTPHDMALFLLAHLDRGSLGGQQMLDPTTEQQMQQLHFTPHASMPGMAYGFMESFMHGQRVLFHTGDRGHHSLFFMLPGQKLGFYLVYTASSNDQLPPLRQDLVRSFMDHYYPIASRFTLPPPPKGFQQRADRFTGIYRLNQCVRSTIEKFGCLPQQAQVSNPGNGTLSVQLGMGGQVLTLVEVQPLLFRAADGTYFAFTQDTSGQITQLDFAGYPIGDPGSARRIDWYENGWLQLAVAITLWLIFVSRFIGIMRRLFGYLFRRRQKQKENLVSVPRVARIADWLADSVSVLVVLSPLILILWLFGHTGPIFGVPFLVIVVLTLLLLASLLGLALMIATVIIWLCKYASLVTRFYLSLLSLASICLLLFLNYWNLLGYRW